VITRSTSAARATVVFIAIGAIVAACDGDVAREIDSCEPGVRPTSGPPNIVVVITDDQTREQMRTMPQTQALLADRGVTFRNMVVNDSNCCPSRVTFLTGQQSRHHGVLWNTPPTGGFAAFEDQDTTLPVALQNAGYRTGYVGKYLNRFGERVPDDRVAPPGWTDFRALVWPAESVYYGAAFFDNGAITESGPDEYVTHEITERALEMIDDFADSGDPFFVVLGHVAPHSPSGIPLSDVIPGQLIRQLADRGTEPAVAEPRYVGRFAAEPLPASPSFNEADVSDKAPVNRRRPLDDDAIQAITDRYRGALESLLSVDDSMAAVVAELERTCTREQTYIVYTSDNGFFYGEHRLPFGKYLPYRPSRSVPLVIAGPGTPAGASVDSVVSNVDLAPTIAELADATLLREPDGISLVPWLTEGRGAERGRAVYLEGHAPEGRLIIPFDAVYTGNELYVELSNGDREYYDLVTDPDEEENLFGDTSAAARISEVRELLIELRACEGRSCGEVGRELPVPSSP
jgi:N-acetylglucosamine-6-sulfatase